MLADGADLDDVVLAQNVVPPLQIQARVRYRHEGAPAVLASGGLTFAAPVRAVTRGQIAVFYSGDRVLGGGRITRVHRHGAKPDLLRCEA